MELSKAIKILNSLSKTPKPSPAPAFSQFHIFLALLAIGDESPVGRIELSRKLGLGEGAARTIIKRLSQAKVITTVKGGCVLTNRGQILYRALRPKLSKIVPIDARALALDRISMAMVIRGAARRVKRGLEQRDAAIRAGATGACTLIMNMGTYFMPTTDRNEEISVDDRLIHDLDGLLHPKDGDAVAIVSAPGREKAEQGAMAAALELLR
jgi:predicted transcriptional regulator